MKNCEKINRNQTMITSLDEMIEENSTVRVVDAYVRSLDVEKLGYHVHTNKVGRPAYDPHEMIGLFLYSYMSRVMSSRMLEKQTYINLEIMWLLNGSHPDHSTIAAFRSENAEALTNTFRDFTNICIDLGLIGKTIVAVDGTKIHANNNKKRNYSEKSLSRKIDNINEQIKKYFNEFDANDKNDSNLSKLEARRTDYETMLEKLKNSEETQISTTDPDSRLMDNKKGGLDVSYNIQATVDEKNSLIIDQYVINAPTDQHELSRATERAQEILSNKKLTVLADKGYYNGEDISKCFSIGARPIVSRQKASVRNGHYSTDDFVYDEETDSFTCPNKEILTKISSEEAKTIVYANKEACRKCPYKQNCFTQGKRIKYRKIIRDKNFKFMVKADKLFKANIKLYRRRQEMSEHVFGSIKRQLGFPQLNVRTKRKVSGEVSLLCLAYNFKRVINLIGNRELIHYLRVGIKPDLRLIMKISFKIPKLLQWMAIKLPNILNYSTV